MAAGTSVALLHHMYPSAAKPVLIAPDDDEAEVEAWPIPLVRVRPPHRTLDSDKAGPTIDEASRQDRVRMRARWRATGIAVIDAPWIRPELLRLESCTCPPVIATLEPETQEASPRREPPRALPAARAAESAAAAPVSQLKRVKTW